MLPPLAFLNVAILLMFILKAVIISYKIKRQFIFLLSLVVFLNIRMKAAELLHNDVPPILPEESMEKALSWMDEFMVKHLPVVKDGKYLDRINHHAKYKDMFKIIDKYLR